MTTSKQRLDFMTELRENFEQNERLHIQSNRSPEEVAELLRDIQEDVIAVRNYELGKTILFCNNCNRPLNEHNKVTIAVEGDHMIVSPGELMCIDCTRRAIENLKKSTAGVP